MRWCVVRARGKPHPSLLRSLAQTAHPPPRDSRDLEAAAKALLAADVSVLQKLTMPSSLDLRTVGGVRTPRARTPVCGASCHNARRAPQLCIVFGFEPSWDHGLIVVKSADFRPALVATKFETMGAVRRYNAFKYVREMGLRSLLEAAGPSEPPAVVAMARWVLEVSAANEVGSF